MDQLEQESSNHSLESSVGTDLTDDGVVLLSEIVTYLHIICSNSIKMIKNSIFQVNMFYDFESREIYKRHDTLTMFIRKTFTDRKASDTSISHNIVLNYRNNNVLSLFVYERKV
jgi:hypothetical protein